MEISEKNRKIRSFYAKKRKRVGSLWVKTIDYTPTPGIVIITCKFNDRQLICRYMDVRQGIILRNSHIRNGHTGNAELDADIAQHGAQLFTVKTGQVLECLAGESDESKWIRLESLYYGYLNSAANIYNKSDIAMSQYIPMYERDSYKKLGGIYGREWQQIKRASEVRGPVVFVLTCKITRKHYVSGAVKFNDQWFKYIRQLRAGIFKNEELQREWNAYGEDTFVCDFIRVDNRTVMEAKKMVLRSLDNLYRDPRKSTR